MPRHARIKSYDSIYHVMVRSITETPLYKERNDKITYMKLVSKYQELFAFKVYGYCLMDNHAHFIIDANGADISRIMHGINFTYAQKYNRKYNRRGPLFYDRFKSKIIQDERYIITLSAYIHNNPTDIKGYETHPELYEFSSLGAYLGLRHDPYNILDEGFIMQLFGGNKSAARRSYIRLVATSNKQSVKDHIDFKDEKTEYRSERRILVRDFCSHDIINYISDLTNSCPDKIHVKNSRRTVNSKALIALLMKNLCNYKCRDICAVFGNISESRVSELCSLGLRIIEEDKRYQHVISGFIKKFTA